MAKKSEKTKGIKFSHQLWNPLEQNTETDEAIQFEKQTWDPIKFGQQKWEGLPGVEVPQVLRTFDGVNRMNPLAIKETMAPFSQNMTSDLYPSMTVRPGMSQVGGTFYRTDGTTLQTVNGLAVYMESELHVITGEKWRRYNKSTGAWDILKESVHGYAESTIVDAKWKFIHFKGNFTKTNLIATRGNTGKRPVRYDGTNIVELANAPLGGDWIATHDSRVYLAVDDKIHYSALNKAEDWSTVDDAGQIVVESKDGEITGMASGPSRLTVFKKEGIYELFGNGPHNYQLKQVTDQIGCVAGQSIQVIDGVMYFAGKGAIYRYTGGGTPQSDFSMPVHDYLKKIPLAFERRSLAWTNNGKYYLGISLDKYGGKVDTILEYDTKYETWYVWKLPGDIDVPMVELDTFKSTQGTTAERVGTRLLYGAMDAKVFSLDSDNDDYGALIEWEWHSKPFTFDSAAVKMKWYRLWVVADIPSGSTVKVYASTSVQGDHAMNFSYLTEFTNEGLNMLETKEILIPTSKFESSRTFRIKLSGTGPVTIHEVTRQARTFPMGL